MIDSHTHTYYSKHAVGSIEDLVRAAIAKSVKILTITDHAPFFVDESNRLLENELQRYLGEIDCARAKYKGSITILKGLEVDYMPGSFYYITRILADLDLDFVIGSIHYIPQRGKYVNVWDLPRLNNPEIMKKYFLVLEEMLQCGLFDAVGHPDVMLRGIPENVHQEYLMPLLPLFRRHQVAYELNASGLRKTTLDPASSQEVQGIWSYPSQTMLPQLLAHNIPVTIGSDAHTPADVGAGILDILRIFVSAGLTTISYFKNRHRIDVPTQTLCADCTN